MAMQFADVEVHGIDISSKFPVNIKPKNCRFHVGNVNEPLPWADETFDFVFVRCMFSAITGASWPSVLREVMRVLKPGGFVEIQDQDLKGGQSLEISFKMDLYIN